jgi:hypothetical protein
MPHPRSPTPLHAPARPRRRLGVLLGVLLGAPLLLVCLTLVVLALALQDQPLVPRPSELSTQDVARAVALLRQHDPRNTPTQVQLGRLGVVQLRAVQLQARDLDLLLNHAAQRWLHANTRVDLQSQAATLHGSVDWRGLAVASPGNPAWAVLQAPWLQPLLQPVLGRWVNLSVQVRETAGLPQLQQLRLGRLPVPVWLAEKLGLFYLHRVGLAGELPVVQELVKRVRFSPGLLSLQYAWHHDSGQQLLAALVSPAERTRLQAYAARVAEITTRQAAAVAAAVAAGQAPSDAASLAGVLGPVFALARERTLAGGDAAEENRAAIVVLTLFANGRNVAAFLPGQPAAAAPLVWPLGGPKPRPLRLQLSGREDWPLHFLVSAALAVEGTGPLSRVVGLYKELADSRGGSGFSFNDMAANRAGTRFGELAVQDPQRLQAALARSATESDFMPLATDLPEFMSEADFVKRFGGVGAPAYEQQMQEIDRRVAALPVLR